MHVHRSSIVHRASSMHVEHRLPGQESVDCCRCMNSVDWIPYSFNELLLDLEIICYNSNAYIYCWQSIHELTQTINKLFTLHSPLAGAGYLSIFVYLFVSGIRQEMQHTGQQTKAKGIGITPFDLIRFYSTTVSTMLFHGIIEFTFRSEPGVRRSVAPL